MYTCRLPLRMRLGMRMHACLNGHLHFALSYKKRNFVKYKLTKFWSATTLSFNNNEIKDA